MVVTFRARTTQDGRDGHYEGVTRSHVRERPLEAGALPLAARHDIG